MKSRPEGDVWKLTDIDAESQHYGYSYIFTFSYIKSEEICDVVKDYVWQNYRTGNRTLSNLYAVLLKFHYFNSFAEIRNIISLKELTNADIDNFISYLRTTLSDKTKKPLSYKSQKGCLDALKAIIHWGQLHRPDAVLDKEIFTGNEYTGVHRKLKIDYIPDDVLNAINNALKTENNAYIKYGIIILESTGMRPGDLLMLRTDCIKPHLISGYTMTWFDHKNRKQRPPLPVRPECAEAVYKLIEATKEIREEVDSKTKDSLFIYKTIYGPKPHVAKRIGKVVMERWLHAFVKRHNILDASGELYNLTCHQFRRTLGTDMLSKGEYITVVQEVLGHARPESSKLYYADIKDKERAKVFKGIGIIGNIDQIDESTFDSVVEMEWFKANKEKCVAGLCDGYCTKHLQNRKICDRLLRRQKCYTCNRYITTPEYLEAHKNHLASLERQLAENAIYGEHYSEHFRPTIEVLKVIIERLEELQDGRN